MQDRPALPRRPVRGRSVQGDHLRRQPVLLRTARASTSATRRSAPPTSTAWPASACPIRAPSVYCPHGSVLRPGDDCLRAGPLPGHPVPRRARPASRPPLSRPDEACIADPCATINCPSDCWTCGVNPDGHGDLHAQRTACASVVTNVGQRGGGESGCGCAVGVARGAAGRDLAGLAARPRADGRARGGGDSLRARCTPWAYPPRRDRSAPSSGTWPGFPTRRRYPPPP